MTGPLHTYGSTCLLADEEPELSSLYSRLTPPEIRSQFFYISSLPIDDPLAPLPPASGQGTGNERAPPKPFSARDNFALETSWQKLGKAHQAKNANKIGSRPDTSQTQSGIAVPGQGLELEAGRRRKIANNRDDTGIISSRSTFSNSPSFPDETPGRHLKSRCGLPTSSEIRTENYTRKHVASSLDDGLVEGPPRSHPDYRKRERSSSLKDVPSSKRRSNSTIGDDDGVEEGQDEAGSLRANRSRDASISGSPFIRAPVSQAHSQFGSSVESLPSKDGAHEWQSEVRSSAPTRGAPKRSGLRATVSLDEMAQDTPEQGRDQGIPKKQHGEVKAKIPVGVSRLHLVELPNLKVCASSGA